MKQLLRAVLCALFVLVAVNGEAQFFPGPRGFVSFGTVSAAGALGPVISFQEMSVPSNYTVEWAVSGTAPTACTFQLEGSLDNTHWYSLTGSQDCTASTMLHVTDKPVGFVRANVLTYTKGDNTTAVSIRYTRGN